MLNRDPRCVFVANTMAAAVVTAAWLTEQGIAAEVMDLMTLGGLEGLTAWAPGISARGLEVWVLDPTKAPEARRLLAEHAAAQARRVEEAKEGSDLEVVCEECGQTSVSPAAQRGTVQDCPHCGEYLDVEVPGNPSGIAQPAPEDSDSEEDPSRE